MYPHVSQTSRDELRARTDMLGVDASVLATAVFGRVSQLPHATSFLPSAVSRGKVVSGIVRDWRYWSGSERGAA
jgi:hypothetical protein